MHLGTRCCFIVYFYPSSSGIVTARGWIARGCAAAAAAATAAAATAAAAAAAAAAAVAYIVVVTAAAEYVDEDADDCNRFDDNFEADSRRLYTAASTPSPSPSSSSSSSSPPPPRPPSFSHWHAHQSSLHLSHVISPRTFFFPPPPRNTFGVGGNGGGGVGVLSLPLQLGGGKVVLRNRVIKAATFESMVTCDV
jgi:hypothetical protein